MRYHYEKPDVSIPVYGELIELSDHPIYAYGTLYLEGEKGIVVVEKKFSRHSERRDTKYCYWGAVDPAIANSIYLSPNFKDFFNANASTKPYPIFQLRKIMWKLRMKPIKKEKWEYFF